MKVGSALKGGQWESDHSCPPPSGLRVAQEEWRDRSGLRRLGDSVGKGQTSGLNGPGLALLLSFGLLMLLPPKARLARDNHLTYGHKGPNVQGSLGRLRGPFPSDLSPSLNRPPRGRQERAPLQDDPWLKVGWAN